MPKKLCEFYISTLFCKTRAPRTWLARCFFLPSRANFLCCAVFFCSFVRWLRCEIVCALIFIVSLTPSSFWFVRIPSFLINIQYVSVCLYKVSTSIRQTVSILFAVAGVGAAADISATYASLIRMCLADERTKHIPSHHPSIYPFKFNFEHTT